MKKGRKILWNDISKQVEDNTFVSHSFSACLVFRSLLELLYRIGEQYPDVWRTLACSLRLILSFAAAGYCWRLSPPVWPARFCIARPWGNFCRWSCWFGSTWETRRAAASWTAYRRVSVLVLAESFESSF